MKAVVLFIQMMNVGYNSLFCPSSSTHGNGEVVKSHSTSDINKSLLCNLSCLSKNHLLSSRVISVLYPLLFTHSHAVFYSRCAPETGRSVLWVSVMLHTECRHIWKISLPRVLALPFVWSEELRDVIKRVTAADLRHYPPTPHTHTPSTNILTTPTQIHPHTSTTSAPQRCTEPLNWHSHFFHVCLV